jgi:hypothetical protein
MSAASEKDSAAARQREELRRQLLKMIIKNETLRREDRKAAQK